MYEVYYKVPTVYFQKYEKSVAQVAPLHQVYAIWHTYVVEKLSLYEHILGEWVDLDFTEAKKKKKKKNCDVIYAFSSMIVTWT